MSYNLVAVVNGLKQAEICIADLQKCSHGVRCQALQSAAFAVFRQHVLRGESAEVFLDGIKLEHSKDGMVTVLHRQPPQGSVVAVSGKSKRRKRVRDDSGSSDLSDSNF